MKGKHSLRFQLVTLVLFVASIVVAISCNKDHSTVDAVQQQLTPEEQAVQKAQDWLKKNNLLEKVSSVKIDNINVATDFNNSASTPGKISTNSIGLIQRPGTPSTPITPTPITPDAPLTARPPAPIDAVIIWDAPTLKTNGCKPMLAVPYKIDRTTLTGYKGSLPIDVTLILKDSGDDNYQVARKISTTVYEKTGEGLVPGTVMQEPVTYEYYYDLNGNLLEAWRKNRMGQYEYLDLLSPNRPESPISSTCAGTITVPFVAMKGCDESSTCTFVYGTRTIGCDRRLEDWGDLCSKIGGGIPTGSGAGFGNHTDYAPDSMKVELKNLCLVNAMAFVNDQDCKNVFRGIMERWSVDDKYDVVVFEDSTLKSTIAGQTDARTGTFRGALNAATFKIGLNINTLPHSSYEYVTSTIMHEVIHAYLTEIKGAKFHDFSEFGNYTQNDGTFSFTLDYPGVSGGHETYSFYDMIGWMKDAMKQLFPYLSDREAWAIAWGGLEKTSAFLALPIADQNYIKQVNYEHSSGQKGITCH
ncbi:hypothetical protein [Pinibacter soli]|uniref:SprT-like domain-containing protein n=1 Tax=Pinibacter soli TaxID=3044211 RepID=A0ABT6R885_9BACT|nr:hypothetical protein [Pinibacter soli]MDI3318770.1 hypothetical protein [Pinibacter soli]